jgi:hypothetical protein
LSETLPERPKGTLIVTTKSGVRPLGVRGQPLHNAAAQLRRVVRRRLGDASADLLADPQLHEDGKAIDWYADAAGEVRRVVDLPPAERSAALAAVDRGLSGIAELGGTLAKVRGGEEDSGVVGRSLQLSARRPPDSFVFLVGDKPIVVCWGYEKDTTAGLLPPTLPATPKAAAHVSVLQAPTAVPVARYVGPYAAPLPWVRTTLLALPLLLLLLGGAWLLREMLPQDPALALATREGPDAPPPLPPVAPERLPLLKASLSQQAARAKALQIEMSAIEKELEKRIANCKPPEVAQAPPKEPPPPPKEPPKDAPKPPQVASVAPPAPRPPQPQPQPHPPTYPGDDRLRLPPGPTNDYSFMSGCWSTDPFRHETVQIQPGISRYCFNSNGYGQLEWRRGRTACRTSAQAQFNGNTLMLRDADTTCNDGSHWFADRLICQRGAGDVALCSGNSRGSYGPVSWSVNLHKLR